MCRYVPEMGYYLVITDTEATERFFFTGLHDSLPPNMQKKLVIKVLRGFLPFLPTARIRQIKISFSYILAIRTCCFLQHVFYTVPKGIRYKNHVTY